MAYDERLKTYVHRLTYDFDEHEGTIILGGPTDMTGCIELFKAIDPAVSLIDTRIRADHDTVYYQQDGVWHAGMRRARKNAE